MPELSEIIFIPQQVPSESHVLEYIVLIILRCSLVKKYKVIKRDDIRIDFTLIKSTH